MADSTVTVQLVPAELDSQHVEADLLIFGGFLAVLATIFVIKWLINYLMAGGRDD